MRPARALMHPLWICALVVLVLNDHVLKGAGVLPGWLTGKLSDFSGLIVAPVILAVIARVRTMRGFVACHVAIGIAFVAIKVPGPLAALHGGWFRNVVDPTDLIALPALLVSLRAFSLPQPPPQREGERVLAMIGAVACMATQPPKPPPCAADAYNKNGVCLEGFHGTLFVANAGRSTTTLSVRVLRQDVGVSCDVLMSDPSKIGCRLRPEMLDPPMSITLRPGEAAPVEPQVCSIAVVSISDWLVPAVIMRRVPPGAHDQFIPYDFSRAQASFQGGAVVDAAERKFTGDEIPWTCEVTP